MKRYYFKKSDSRGFAALMTAITISAFALMATTEVTYRTVQENTKLDQYSEMKAEWISGSGLEYAKNQLQQGIDPTLNSMSMQGGSLNIYTDPTNNIVTATGYFAKAQAAHSIQAQFGKDCLAWDLSTAHTAGNQIIGAKFNTTCNPMPTVIISQVQSSWTEDESDKITEFFITGQGQPLTAEYDSTVDSPLAGALNGVIMNNKDYVISQNGVIPINHIQYNVNPIHGARTYTMTAYLGDGSSITDSFTDPTPYVPPVPPITLNNQNNLDIDPGRTAVIDVIGSAISCGAGGNEIAVKVSMRQKTTGNWSSWSSLWGGADVDGGETYSEVTASGIQDTTYQFKARAVLSGCYDQTFTSNQTAQVRILKNGDAAPPLAGFGGQKPVMEFLDPYLNDQGIVVLNTNQYILLWELGVNMTYNPNSPAADFQDLVLLVTAN